ncbi:hypothetical protein EDB80DRAFT_730533 [Ilyonectria destructans]|nr:hypothetical protein EDB80DRAFT_730533 [Ilyonectria destructans]
MSGAAMSGAAPASEPPYSCSACPKTYKRREHLQRHAVSHSTVRPYRCTVCSNSYQRADVLRRHSQMCQAKASVGGVPAGASSGRRGCDLCVRQKKACGTGQPCDNCRRKCVPCCYSFGLDAVVARKDEDNRSLDTEIVSSVDA